MRAPSAAEAAELEAGVSLIALLAKMEMVETVTGGKDPSPAGAGVAGSVEIFLPMEGLIDLEKERARLTKELAGIEGWMKGCRAKLGNEKFTANAPDHVVQKQKDLLAENETKAGKLQELLDAYQKDFLARPILCQHTLAHARNQLGSGLDFGSQNAGSQLDCQADQIILEPLKASPLQPQ